MKNKLDERRQPPALEVHVAEPGTRALAASLRCQIGREVEFSTESLESYFFSAWRPEAYDALARRGGGGIRGQEFAASRTPLAARVQSARAGARRRALATAVGLLRVARSA